MFLKYMHLERYGNEEVDGIEQRLTITKVKETRKDIFNG